MKTRQEIEAIVGGYRENERPSKIAEALLEVMLYIRDALLDPEGAKVAYHVEQTIVQLKEQTMEVIPNTRGIETVTHPGWTCQDAHSPISHEQWASGQTIYETTETENSSLDAADQQAGGKNATHA